MLFYLYILNIYILFLYLSYQVIKNGKILNACY